MNVTTETIDSFEKSFIEVKTSKTGKRLSKILHLDFEENDDKKEKKANYRRNSTMLEMGLARNAKVAESTVKSNGFSSEQIANHYGACMKLASENKITAKNSFDLHIIEYLKEYMHVLQSFQKASSSLDAGAKVYSGRVDLVHSTTYNILTGSNDGNNAPGDIIEEPVVNPDDEDATAEIKTKKPKKRDVHKNMITTNIRKIRLTASQIRTEDDPLSRTLANKFDEGSTGQLSSNNLRLVDDTYGLLVDFDTLVSTKMADNEHMSDLVFDISEFEDKLVEMCNDPTIIPINFEEFKFTGWDPSSDVMDIQAVESYRNLKKIEDSLLHQNEEDYQFEDNGAYDDYRGYNDESMMVDENQPIPIDDDTMMKEDEHEDNLLRIGSSKNDAGSSMFVSSVKDMVNSYMENYGEINDNILGMWAGPDHWKKKAKPIKIYDNNIIKVKVKKTIRAKVLVPMFKDWVRTKLNGDGVGRLVEIEQEEVNQNPRASTQLTDMCLNNNIKKEYLLPQRSQFILKSINQLMNRDISLVNKAIKKHAEQMANINLDDEQEHDINTNANDAFEIVDKDMIVIDDNGNISEHYNGGDDYNFDNENPYTGISFTNEHFGDEMDDNIRNPEPVGINYAKTAKKINAKKIKHDILTFLTDKVHMVDYSEISKKVYPDVHLSKEVCSLSEVFISVDKSATPEMAQDLSVSIVMTCILHLVNETGIDIKSLDDFSDFILGQGYSSYDMEQIKLYGIGNDLYKDTRKRLCNDSIILGYGKSAQKGRMLIAQDSDSE